MLDSEKIYNPTRYRIYDDKGLAPTITSTDGHGGRGPHTIIEFSEGKDG